jgi:hypothetical protein
MKEITYSQSGDYLFQQMEWVGTTNELKHEAEEIALCQIVYK